MKSFISRHGLTAVDVRDLVRDLVVLALFIAWVAVCAALKSGA
jgi:hypothetical protein